jgi:hypothetical protein
LFTILGTLLVSTFYRSIQTSTLSGKIHILIYYAILSIWIQFNVMSFSTNPLHKPASAFPCWVIVSLEYQVSEAVKNSSGQMTQSDY